MEALEGLGMEVDPPLILDARVHLTGDLIRGCRFDLVFLRRMFFLLIIFVVLAWSL